MKQKVLALSLLAGSLAVGTTWAIQQNIDVAARLRVGLAFSNKVDMNFTPAGTDHIDFYGTPAGTNTVTMGTDGSVTPDGTVFQTTVTTGTPGSVDITGDGVSAVNITCTTQAVMAEPSATTITVDQLELTMDNPKPFQDAAAYACDGLGASSTTPFTPTLTGSNTLAMGGRLVGNATIRTGDYSTTNTGVGGVPATIQVVYQ